MTKTCDQKWASDLVVQWCNDRAEALRRDAKLLRTAYSKSPLNPLCQEYSDLLDKQRQDWIAKALEIKGRLTSEKP